MKHLIILFILTALIYECGNKEDKVLEQKQNSALDESSIIIVDFSSIDKYSKPMRDFIFQKFKLGVLSNSRLNSLTINEAQLKQIKRQYKLSDDLFNMESIKIIGQIYGANYVVIGNILVDEKIKHGYFSDKSEINRIAYINSACYDIKRSLVHDLSVDGDEYEVLSSIRKMVGKINNSLPVTPDYIRLEFSEFSDYEYYINLISYKNGEKISPLHESLLENVSFKGMIEATKSMFSVLHFTDTTNIKLSEKFFENGYYKFNFKIIDSGLKTVKIYNSFSFEINAKNLYLSFYKDAGDKVKIKNIGDLKIDSTKLKNALVDYLKSTSLSLNKNDIGIQEFKYDNEDEKFEIKFSIYK